MTCMTVWFFQMLNEIWHTTELTYTSFAISSLYPYALPFFFEFFLYVHCHRMSICLYFREIVLVEKIHAVTCAFE